MVIKNDEIILDFFYKWEKEKPNEVYLKQPFGNTFKDFTWKEAGQQARKMATYLNSLGLPKGSGIALISKNCAEWIISDLAIMMSGFVSVPLYSTLNGPQINQVLTHSECKVAFIGKIDNWSEMKTGIPKDVNCISFPTYNPDPEHNQWNDILDKNEPLKENFRGKLEDVMTIIYTSGTTGNPKGVILTNTAITEGVIGTYRNVYLERSGTRFFSYLPLCHIAERNLVETSSFITGGVIYFADTLDTFAKNLRDARPTHFLAVPRIWTKFQQGILKKMPQKKLDLFLKIPILNSFIKNKIKKGLGLNLSWINLTGAAPMPTSLIQWYRKLGIIIQEAYGMTENMGAVCMMPPDQIKDGTVGKLYSGMEVKIDPNSGEILTRSGWNMKGYFKEPEQTANTIDSENWIHTGDVGELDADNFLKITGRVKEMYKTSKGEYIAPTQIEIGFAVNDAIDQVCVIGQSLPQPIALVVISEIGNELSKDELIENLEQNLKNLNPKLKSYEKVQKIVVIKENWTVENNKLTPTFKIKRNIIEAEFESKADGWYNEKKTVIFE